LAFLCVAVVYGQRPGNLAGTVVNVADGDTISIVDKRKIVHLIRLSGIDAPEKGQKYSEQAQQYLSSLIYGKDVTVEGKSYDRFGRLRGKVLLKGRDINLEMVIAGLSDAANAELQRRGAAVNRIAADRQHVVLPSAASPDEAIATATAGGGRLVSLNPVRDTLEDFFLTQVQQTGARRAG